MTDFKLRKWKSDDIPDVFHYANNKKIADNLRNVFPYPYALADAESYISSCIDENEDMQLTRAIEADGHAVGSIGIFRKTDVYEKNGELGYWLAEEYWGRGIMSEAARRICGEVFEMWDIQRIYAEPYAYNTGSRRVLEHAGFTLEGILKNNVYKNGTIYDSCIYALLR